MFLWWECAKSRWKSKSRKERKRGSERPAACFVSPCAVNSDNYLSRTKMKSDRDKFSIFYIGILTRTRYPVLSKGQIPDITSSQIPVDVQPDRQTTFFV